MTQVVTLTRQLRLGIVTLHNPPVNALSHALRVQLRQALEDAFADREIEAIVLCCEGRTFVAGADIREFGKPPIPPDVPELVEFVGAAEKPMIAAIHGTALGGGLELSLACHFRVATSTAKLGFPEVTLGILPGAGGTQRLPRLIGVRGALDMIVGGAPVDAARALELGLVDAIVDGELKSQALEYADRLLTERIPVRRLSALAARLEEPALLEDYEASIREQCRGLLAPFHCIRAIRAAVDLPFDEGLKRERELFLELIDSPQSKAQRHVFFAERELVKIPGVPEGTRAREVKRAAVIGAGNMGAGVAICLADARLPVTLVDASQEGLERGLALVRRHYADAVASGRLHAGAVDERLSFIRPTLSYEETSSADLVIEAVSENSALKREVFARLDTVCKQGAILATTTSSLDIDQLAAATNRPADVLGMHFARPAHRVRLLEVARARATAPEVVATAAKVGRTLGKISVPVIAHPGFVGNRMASVELREAFFLLEEGALPEQVDRALYDFGFPSGPFAAADRNGLDTIALYRELNYRRLGPREQACDLLEKVCALGRFGQKAGAGFYRYEPDGERKPDPAIEELIIEHSKARGISRRTIAEEEILERCLYALINEGAAILQEGVAVRPLDIDMVWIHGYDFPAHRGGPLFHADRLGLGRIQQAILGFQARLGPECWVPAPLLERLVKGETGFYDTD